MNILKTEKIHANIAIIIIICIASWSIIEIGGKIMRKIATVLLVLLMAVTACVAVNATSFDDWLWCNGTGDSFYRDIDGTWTASAKGAVYVYHSCDAAGPNTNYTNHFRVYIGSNTSASANKWCTPGQNIRISCSSITKGCSVRLKARGNTKYETMDYDTINVSGTYGYPKK